MTQTGADLVSAGYPTSNPLLSLLGSLANNGAQANLPAFTNLVYGFGNPTDGALAASGVVTSVAIPVPAGATISKITILVGATAASTPTHGFAALYSGIAVPALIGQSADSTTTAIPASAAFTYTLSAAQTITAAQAPNGFIYAAISGTGTAVQTALSVATPTAVFYQWNTSAPLGVAVTHGSAVAGVAPATIASPSAKAVAPVVILT